MEQIKRWWGKGYLGSMHLSEVSEHSLLIPLFVVYGRAEHHGGKITLKEKKSPYGAP